MGPTTTAAGEALRSIAADTVHPVAQRVLAQNPSLADHLAGNHHLSDETFVRLYPNARIPVGRAKRLVARDGLTDAQFAHVLKVEKRASVLITALDDARLPDAWMDAMLDAPAFTRAVADRAVAAYGPALQAAWMRAAADKVGGLARLTVWLQEASSVTDEQVAAALADLRPWCASPARDKHVKTAIVWLLATRPGAIAGAARSTDPRVPAPDRPRRPARRGRPGRRRRAGPGRVADARAAGAGVEPRGRQRHGPPRHPDVAGPRARRR